MSESSSDLSRTWNIVVASVQPESQLLFQAKLADFFVLSLPDARKILKNLPVILLGCPAKEVGTWIQSELACQGVELLLSNDEGFCQKCYRISWPETWINLSDLPQIGLLAPDQGDSSGSRINGEPAQGLDRRIGETKALYKDLYSKLENLLQGTSSQNKETIKERLAQVEPGSLQEAHLLLEDAEKKFLQYEETIGRLIGTSNQFSAEIQGLQQRLASGEKQTAFEKNKVQYFLMQLRRFVASRQSLEVHVSRLSQEVEEKNDQNKAHQHSQKELQDLLAGEKSKIEKLNKERVDIQVNLYDLEQMRKKERTEFDSVISKLEKKVNELEGLIKHREEENTQHLEEAHEKIRILKGLGEKIEMELRSKAQAWDDRAKLFHDTETELRSRLMHEDQKLAQAQKAMQVFAESATRDKNDFENTVRSLRAEIDKGFAVKEQADIELKARIAEWDGKAKKLQETEAGLRSRLTGEEQKVSQMQKALQVFGERAACDKSDFENTARNLQEEIDKGIVAKEQADIELKVRVAEWDSKLKKFQEIEAGLMSRLMEEDRKALQMQKELQVFKENAARDKSDFENVVRKLQEKLAEVEQARADAKQDFLRQSQETLTHIRQLEENEMMLKGKITHEKPLMDKQVELQSLIQEEHKKFTQIQNELVRVQAQVNSSEQLRLKEKNAFEKALFEMEQKVVEANAVKRAGELKMEKLEQEKQIQINALEQAEKNRGLFLKDKIAIWEESKTMYEQKQIQLRAQFEQEQTAMVEVLRKHAQAESDFKNQIQLEQRKVEVLQEKVKMLTEANEKQNLELNNIPDHYAYLEEQNQQFRAIFQDKISELTDLQCVTREEQEKTKLILENNAEQITNLSEAKITFEKDRVEMDGKLKEVLAENELGKIKNEQLAAELSAVHQDNDQLQELFHEKILELTTLHEKVTQQELQLKSDAARMEERAEQRVQDLEKRLQTTLLEQKQKEQEWSDKYSALGVIKDGILSSLKTEQRQLSEISKAYKKMEEQLRVSEGELASWKKDKAALEDKLRDHSVLQAAGYDRSRDGNAQAQKVKNSSAQGDPSLNADTGRTGAQHMEMMLELEDQRTRAQEWQRKARELEKELFLLRSKFADFK